MADNRFNRPFRGMTDSRFNPQPGSRYTGHSQHNPRYSETRNLRYSDPQPSTRYSEPRGFNSQPNLRYSDPQPITSYSDPRGFNARPQTAPERPSRFNQGLSGFNPANRTVSSFNLGPDSIRKHLLSRIKASVEHLGVPRSIAPFTTTPISVPDIPVTDAGRALVLFDSVCTIKHYASTISRSCLDLESGNRLLHGHDTMATGTLSWMHPLMSRCAVEPIMRYEVEIKKITRDMLGRLADDEFVAWKKKGMYYPLLFAVTNMHTMEDWLPMELHGDVNGFQSILLDLGSWRTVVDANKAMERLVNEVNWASPGGISIAATIDHISTLMGVLSNSEGDCDLNEAIRGFPNWSQSPVWDVWPKAKREFETRLPPSLLCPALSVHSRPTWGYPQLTLTFSLENGLRIKENKLQWIGGDITRVPRTLIGTDEYCAINAAKLRSFLLRMGELLTTPELAYAMLHNSVEQDKRETPEQLLEIMSLDEPTIDKPEEIGKIISDVNDNMPKPVFNNEAIRVAAWKVTPPYMVTLYNAKTPAEDLSKPHTFRRIVLNQRCSVSPVSRVLYLPSFVSNEEFRDMVRGDMRAFLRSSSMSISQPVSIDGNNLHTHTPLYEALFALGCEPPVLHTEINMGESVKWESEHVDSRYAETQLARNGSKYKDTVVMSHVKASAAKSTLLAHVAEFPEGYYSTYFPWRATDGNMHWIKVTSSLSPELMVIHQNGESKNIFDGFVHSINKRYMKNTRLLPVKDPSHLVSDNNAALYFDPRTNMALIAYSPTCGSEKQGLEFMSFQLVRQRT